METKLIPKKGLTNCYKFQKNYTGEKHSFSYWKKKYAKYPELFIGCYKNAKLIGICVGRPKGKTIILTSIAINKKYEKKGLGKKLLKFFEKQVKKSGKNKISLGAANAPTNVVGFYAKSGYKVVKPYKKYTVMEKRI